MHALDLAQSDPGDAPQPERFEALYRGEFSFVWSVAAHLGVPAGAIEDVVQDVFLVAYRRLDHLRFEVSPRAWLFGVTRRVAFRYRRGAARRARQHSALAELARPLVDAPQQRHDDARQLDRLLARLSDSTRAVWQMTELLGMSAPEIASELGVPLNTVYSRLRIARSQLQALAADPSLLGAWRDGARRRQDPPEAAQQRTWALLLPVLGKPGAGTGAGALAWMKTQSVMATTWIATGAVVVGLAVRPAAPPDDGAAAAPARAAQLAATPRAAAPSSPAPDVAVAPAVIPGAERRLSSRTGASRPADAQAHLAEEIALIDRAHAQLAADDAPAALATLATHAQRFPAGTLADIREVAQVDALCRRGDADAAESHAQRLVIDHPASAVAQRFTNFRCPR